MGVPASCASRSRRAFLDVTKPHVPAPMRCVSASSAGVDTRTVTLGQALVYWRLRKSQVRQMIWISLISRPCGRPENPRIRALDTMDNVERVVALEPQEPSWGRSCRSSRS